MPKIAIGSETLNNLDKALQKEWITTNGLGGYASSTVTGCNTRRYHGLLVVSGQENKERAVLLSKLEETIKIGQKYYYLSTNKYSDDYIHPHGYAHLRKFEQAPFPRFIYTINNIIITREIFMPYDTNTVVIRYNIIGGEQKFNFIIHPLAAFSDFHKLPRENKNFNTQTTYENNILTINPYPDFSALKIQAKGMEFKNLKNWYKSFNLDKEKERGLDYIQDLFNPGYFWSPQTNNLKLDIVATIDDVFPENIDKIYSESKHRVDSLFEQAKVSEDDSDEKSLVLAADMHIIKPKTADNGRRVTVVAGYHWFGDWGRDTFIALPGLTLCTGRHEDAKNILLTFAGQCKDGLIPNRFADLGQDAIYNTVDASLWYVNAVHEYLKHTGDYDFVRENIYPVCKNIIENYKKGTNYNIGMDSDGLIRAGEEGCQLTWMDAKVGNWVVTPRHGKPVEINALWYNALKIMENLAQKFGETKESGEFKSMAETTCKSFNEKFWYQRGGYLYDVLSETAGDDSFRPNQLFAVSLPYAVLDEDKWQTVVNKVFEKLYIPFGVRSLSPDNPNYKGACLGTIKERDGAYHQGTAWGWVLGPFLEAYIKANGMSPQALARAEVMMDLWMGELHNGGQNTLSEIMDGDEPFTVRGCISQAWSIAEALRLKQIINSNKPVED
ncbi:MAG: amylo-alpha-1,6-glucosidase [Firmicutes bacterium]|nr:amylo-alpha-1,6-glucosidase [Bacillota bacterium]